MVNISLAIDMKQRLIISNFQTNLSIEACNNDLFPLKDTISALGGPDIFLPLAYPEVVQQCNESK